MKKKILVLAAHPDDETLGCGGTIANYSCSGHIVHVLFFSDGVSSRSKANKKDVKNRKNDTINASKVLGIRRLQFNNFPDNSFDQVSTLTFAKIIEKKIKAFKPETVYTHFNSDLNLDHRKISDATLIATRPQKKTTVKKVLMYEVPSSTEWNFSKKEKFFNPNWFNDISSTLKLKITALKCYKKEIRKFPHPRSEIAINSLARWRGSTAGYKAAEAFFLARKI